ncbi:hypothetical protein TNCV_4400181 [Trichonephila clavipes]|nr:hypothetical protein TNCV_4400181 [Trichonephila clavipes]
MSMKRYTNAELVDIHFIYSLANINERADDWLYEERYPTRRQPNNQISTQGHQNLGEHRSFRATIENTGRAHTAQTLKFEESGAQAVVQNIGTSVQVPALSTSSIFEHVHQSMSCRCRECMSMPAISNNFCEAFTSYFFIIVFLCM